MLFTKSKDNIKRTTKENISKSIIKDTTKPRHFTPPNVSFTPKRKLKAPIKIISVSPADLVLPNSALPYSLDVKNISSKKSKFSVPNNTNTKHVTPSNTTHMNSFPAQVPITERTIVRETIVHEKNMEPPKKWEKETLQPMISREANLTVSKAVSEYMKKTEALQQSHVQENKKIKQEMESYVQQTFKERMSQYMNTLEKQKEQEKKSLEGIMHAIVKERIDALNILRKSENEEQKKQLSLKLKDIDGRIAELIAKQNLCVSFEQVDMMMQDKVSKKEMSEFIETWNLKNMKQWTERYMQEWMQYHEHHDEDEHEIVKSDFEEIIEPTVARIIHRVLKYDRTDESDTRSINSNNTNVQYEHAYEEQPSRLIENKNPLFRNSIVLEQAPIIEPIADETKQQDTPELVDLGTVYKNDYTGMFENELRNKTAKKWTRFGNGVETGNIIDMFLDKKNRKIYIAGHFKHVDSIPIENIAVFDMRDKMWKHVGDGIPQVTSSIAVDEINERVFVGGIFSKVGKGEGQIKASNIAMYDVKQNKWFALGDGLNRDCTSIVFDEKRNVLYAAGSFTNSGKDEIRYVAIYDFQTQKWSSLQGGSVNAPCRVILKHPTLDLLYLGGLFTHTCDDTIHLSYIAKYDIENSTWHNLSGGLQGYCNALAIDEEHDNLYIGGTFISAGENDHSVDAHHIAKYDIKSGTWDTMNGGVNNVVQSIFYDKRNEIVYVGGSFTNTYESGLELNYIAKYDPEKEKWSALDNYFPNSKEDGENKIGLDGTCKALAMDEKTLFISGKFKNAGNVSANSIARYALSRSSM